MEQARVRARTQSRQHEQEIQARKIRIVDGAQTRSLEKKTPQGQGTIKQRLPSAGYSDFLKSIGMWVPQKLSPFVSLP